jgi:hypothetical protein
LECRGWQYQAFMIEFAEQVKTWFSDRVPDDWFLGEIDVSVDRDEILVLGELAAPDVPKKSPAAIVASASMARLDRFRDTTREARKAITGEAEPLFNRKVSWGALCGGQRKVFTQLSVPVMTRLRMSERAVLDTLVDASVARSRSDALAWCVRLVGANQARWIEELRDALVHVEKVRADGPPATGE